MSNTKNRPACCLLRLRWSACLLRDSNRCLLAALALFNCLPDCLLGCLLAQPAGGRSLRGCAAAQRCLLAACSLGRSLLGCARVASLQLLACRRAAPACFSGARCSCSAGGCVAWAAARLAACLPATGVLLAASARFETAPDSSHTAARKAPSFKVLNPKPN